MDIIHIRVVGGADLDFLIGWLMEHLLPVECPLSTELDMRGYKRRSS